MRRTALTLILFGALAAPAQAAPAKVVLTECAPADRPAALAARMGKVDEATKLTMRFTLQVRKAGRKTYRRVAAPGFRSWSTAAPGATSWVFSRRVESLLGPARYRAQVRFQWLDASGAVIARAKRSSRSCFQPDHRPNLRLKGLSREGEHRYAALVVNNGRTDSGPFDVQLAVGPTLLEPVTIAGLAPGTKRLVTLRGPVCQPDASVTVTADPLDLVDERSETDNALTIACE